MRHYLTDTFRELLRTFTQPFDHYRPELHYMRGPGPKCLAKKSRAANVVKNAAPPVAAADALPGHAAA